MKRLLTVYDEGYVMWRIVVDEDRVEEVSNLIKTAHDEFYNDFDLQDEYGGYYEFVNEILDGIEGLEFVEGDELEL